jgi:hypothetical protein
VTDCTSLGSQSKSGKPWPRLTAPFSAASDDITVKMVVPTAGSLVLRVGVRGVAVDMGVLGKRVDALCLIETI